MPRKGDKAVHVWLPSGSVKMIDYLAVDWEMNRTEALRRLIEEALANYHPLAKRNELLEPADGDPEASLPFEPPDGEPGHPVLSAPEFGPGGTHDDALAISAAAGEVEVP